MSDASVWKPGSDVPLVTNEVNVFQAFVATAAQTVFTLTDFVYVPNSDAMRVTVNGVMQVPGRDFTETSGTVVTLAFTADADDDVVLWGVTNAEYSTAATLAAASATAAAASAVSAAASASDLANGIVAFVTPVLGIATATSLQAIIGNVTPAAGTFTTLTATGAFTSLGIEDNATAVALTLSGSGANSVTIANSATNPTIASSAGGLVLSAATGFVTISSTGIAGLVIDAATGNAALNALYINGVEVGRISAAAANNVNIATGSAAAQQVSITHTASADRYITLTGSNGGNPTIGTSAGALTISSQIITSSSLTVGTNAFTDGYLQVNYNEATPAGGAATSGLFFGSAAIGIYFGSGAPTLVGTRGALYLRTDGSATNNRAYINTDGGTTWTALTTAA